MFGDFVKPRSSAAAKSGGWSPAPPAREPVSPDFQPLLALGLRVGDGRVLRPLEDPAPGPLPRPGVGGGGVRRPRRRHRPLRGRLRPVRAGPGAVPPRAPLQQTPRTPTRRHVRGLVLPVHRDDRRRVFSRWPTSPTGSGPPSELGRARPGGPRPWRSSPAGRGGRNDGLHGRRRVRRPSLPGSDRGRTEARLGYKAIQAGPIRSGKRWSLDPYR